MTERNESVTSNRLYPANSPKPGGAFLANLGSRKELVFLDNDEKTLHYLDPDTSDGWRMVASSKSYGAILDAGSTVAVDVRLFLDCFY